MDLAFISSLGIYTAEESRVLFITVLEFENDEERLIKILR